MKFCITLLLVAFGRLLFIPLAGSNANLKRLYYSVLGVSVALLIAGFFIAKCSAIAEVNSAVWMVVLMYALRSKVVGKKGLDVPHKS